MIYQIYLLFQKKLPAAFQLSGRGACKFLESPDKSGAVAETNPLRRLHNADSFRQKPLRFINTGLIDKLQKAVPCAFFVN